MNPSFPGAYCALHRAAPATRTCGRCGNFMCWDCSQAGTRDSCPSCVELASSQSQFPFTRDNQEGLFGYAWEAFKRGWGMLTVTALVYFAVIFGAQLIGAVLAAAVAGGVGAASGKSAGAAGAVGAIAGQGIGLVVQMALQGALGLGFIRVAWGVLNGRTADLGMLFSQFHKVGKYFLQIIIVALMVVVPLGVMIAAVMGGVFYAFHDTEHRLIAGGVAVALLFIPTLVVMIPLYFAQVELALNDQASAWQTIVNAWRIGSGKRLTILAYAMLIGLVAMAGVVLCLVGFVPAMALCQLLFVGIYAALRNGSEATPIRGEQPALARPAY